LDLGGFEVFIEPAATKLRDAFGETRYCSLPDG
jgi:hypothetical protein